METLRHIEQLLLNSPKALIIVRGVPGSGKSTFANLILDRIHCLSKIHPRMKTVDHFEADQFFYKKYGKYEWKKEELSLAHAWCHLSTECSMMRENHVIVSNTFVKNDHIEPYIELAKKFGYNWVVVRATGKFDNVHNVPAEVVKRMENQIEHHPCEFFI